MAKQRRHSVRSRQITEQMHFRLGWSAFCVVFAGMHVQMTVLMRRAGGWTISQCGHFTQSSSDFSVHYLTTIGHYLCQRCQRCQRCWRGQYHKHSNWDPNKNVLWQEYPLWQELCDLCIGS